MFKLLGGIFLGWSLGSNDSANVFGTAVANNIIKFRTAVTILATLVLIGALAEGYKGFATLGNITKQTPITATVASFAAALTVTLMTYLGLPVSTSQAIVGAIIGIGIVNRNVNLSALPKIFSAWVLTPVGAAIISFLLYLAIRIIIKKYIKNQVLFDKFILVGFYLVGGYGAYALGANNVANVTGIYVTSGMLTPFMGALLGGLSIGFGAITYSKNVMMTVGKKLLPLDYYSAFIAILAEAITVHIYAVIGIPVSTSQAIVGGVLGIGLVTGTRTINKRTLRNILFGWVGTPTISGIISFGIFKLVGLL